MTTKQSSFDELIEQNFEALPARSEGWSHSDQIFCCNGQGYGIADSGATVCLGNTRMIELFFKTGLTRGLNRVQIEILNTIKKLEVEIGQSKSAADYAVKSSCGKRAIQTGGVRARSNVHSEFKPVNTGHIKARKKLPLRQTFLNSQVLHG
jgi:hypothetical protein